MSKKSSGQNATEHQNAYISKAYDRITVLMPKGQREPLQAHAKAMNESTNAFINRAIKQTMGSDVKTGKELNTD